MSKAFDSYSKYLSLKQAIAFKVRGYDAQALLLKDLLYVVYGKTKVPRFTLRNYIRQLFTRYQYDALLPLARQHEIVLTVLQDRPDHREFMEKISRKVNNAVIFSNAGIELHPIRIFSFRNIAVVATALLSFATRKRFSWREKLYFSLLLAQYLHTLHVLKDQFRPGNYKIKKFVAFNGPYGLDALLTAHFNSIGVPTYSIQHGIFYDYKLYVPYDIINYEFTLTDKILCWGKNAAEVLQNRGIDAGKLIIAGNPKYNEGFVFKPLKNTFRSCLMMLARFIYDEGNREMMSIVGRVAQRMNIKVYIKPHPSLYVAKEVNFAAYQQLAEEFGFTMLDRETMLTELLDDDRFDFSICYNTGAYVEAYGKGLICLRYAAGENDYIEGLDDRFSDEQSLQEKIESLRSADLNVLTQNAQTMVNDVLGVKNDAYKSVLNS